MKSIFILGFLFLFISSSAQSLYRPRISSEINLKNEESFTINVERSLYSITFEQNDRNLNKDLKARIKNFLEKTRVIKFRKMGSIQLKIIKRNQIYYVVEKNKPEKLLELL